MSRKDNNVEKEEGMCSNEWQDSMTPVGEGFSLLDLI